MLKIAFEDKDLIRFWKKVDKSGECWTWIAARDWKGYGQFRVSGYLIKAHRFSYQASVGEPTLFVLHKCDNPPCVRPSHLFEGTNQDNMRDMVSKGRQNPNAMFGDNNPARKYPERVPRGSKQGLSKLVESDIPTIKELVRQGKLHREVADMYNVSRATISYVIQGRTWRHVC